MEFSPVPVIFIREVNIGSVISITIACEASGGAGAAGRGCTNGTDFDTNSGIAPARDDRASRGLALSTIGIYLKPRTLAEALTALSSSEARILSGGTDFYPALGERVVEDAVIDVSALAELRGVTADEDCFRIGGLTTWTEIIRAPLPRCFDALKSAAREVGSVQIQNRGTVAGNLCNASPAADGVPPLLALDAEVELVSGTATRRMKLEQFLVGNRKTERRVDEILTAVLVPRRLDNAASAFLKLGARRYLVISIAMVAAIVATDNLGHIAEARVAVGSCSVVARRLRTLESELVGATVSAGFHGLVRPEHLSPLSPIHDVRATAEYRMDAALTLVQRALNACAGIK
jgi:CO/xanthine dehydrogenase FAD-binding subunit